MIIPNLMESVGQEILRTPSGVVVELEKLTTASITKKNKAEAFKWLEDHNEGGMIKKETVRSVHHMTLGAWVRGKIKEKADIPRDLFGIYERTVAKVR